MNTIVSQAMATGLPVITTNHSGLPEQVLDGKNGAVVPEGDFHALADSIIALVEREDLWPDLGRFGRAYVEENYDSKKLIDRQIVYYNELACSEVNLIDCKPDHASKPTRPLMMRTENLKQLSSDSAKPHWTQEYTNAIWSEVWNPGSAPPIEALFQERLFIEGCATYFPHIQKSGQSFLEVACGTGRYGLWFARELPECQFVLTDITDSSLSLVNRYAQQLQLKNVTVRREDARALNFEQDSFDIVFSDAALQYLPDPDLETAVRELIRVLRPGGRLIVSTANLWNLPYTFTKLIQGKNYPYGYERSFSPRKLRKLFGHLGVEVLTVDGFFPAYSLLRLARYHPAWRLVGSLANKFSRVADKLMLRACSKYFGCFVLVVATKR